MAKFRTSILIIGLLVIVVAASLLTVLALYITGAVVTERIELVYSVYDMEKEYDGTPLVADKYELVSGELLNGHYALVEFSGAQTDAGQSRSSLSVKICDEKGYDVTSEYKIHVNSGLLKVLPREVSVVLNDEEVVYNGSKITFENYTITEGELVSGHKIAGAQSVQLINVDEAIPTDLGVIVLDASGKDVTRNYKVDFSYNDKRIKVVKRPLTVKPVDKIKVYDGEEMALRDVEILSGSLADGQYIKSVEINYNGERLLDATEKDIVTRVTDIMIFQRVGSDEVDVTRNYDIDTTETGIARIEKRKLTIVARSGSWEYDGTDHDLTRYTTPLSCEGLAPGEVLSSVKYSGSVKEVKEVKENIIVEIRLYNTALDTTATTTNYDITYVNGTLTVTRREVTIITPTISKVYDGTPLSGASLNDRPLGLNLATDHKIIYDSESLISFTDCGTKANQLECRIVDRSDSTEKDLSENYKITYVTGQLTITKRPARISTLAVSKEYDGTTLSAFETEEDIDTYNLLAGHRLSLPSDADIRLTDVGKKYPSFTVKIMEGDSDVTSNYDIDYQFGYLEITRLNLTIKTAGLTREYDGTTLVMGEDETVFEGLPSDGRLTAVLDVGQQYPELKKVDRVQNKVEYKLVCDGNLVDAKNYKIDYQYGYLEITPCELYLSLKNINETFNNEAHDLSLAEALEGNNLKNWTVDIFDFDKSYENSFVNAGTYSYSVKIKDASNSSNFNLRISGGSVTIAKCEVEVRLKDYNEENENAFVYDKTVIYSIDAHDAITLNGLNGGINHLGADSFNIVTVGTLKNAGSYTYTVRFIDSNFDRNHVLYIYGGDVTILKSPIKINEVNCGKKYYNGKSQLPDIDYVIRMGIVGQLPNGLTKDDFKIVTINGDAINASDEYYKFTVQMIDSHEQENYDLDVTPGVIKIEKAVVNIVLPTKSVTYDGLSHLPKISELVGDELTDLNLKESRLEVIADGDIKNVGNYTYTVEFRYAADEDNYELSFTDTADEPVKNGVIDIEPCEVSIKLKNYTAQYSAAEKQLSFANLVADVSCASDRLEMERNLSKYFELYCTETIKNAKTYNYGVRFIYRDDMDNFTLKLLNEGGAEIGEAEYTVNKINVELESHVAGFVKTYDGEVATVDTISAIASKTIVLTPKEKIEDSFDYYFSANCVGTDASVGMQPLYFTNVFVYNIYGENITSNFEILNSAEVTVEITPRDITFTLDDYFYTGRAPSSGSPEYTKCLGVSMATPLLSGYTVDFSYVNITVQNESTLITYDIDNVIIYDKSGREANGNFFITNTNDGYLSSSLIKVG